MNERIQPTLSARRLSQQEVYYLKRQSGYERLPFLRETCLPTLSSAMYQFSSSFEDDLIKASRRKMFIDIGRGEKTNPFGDIRNHVLFVEGQPGAGKSYITRHTILPFLETSAEIWKKDFGIDVSITHLHWDEIENILIERNIIAPEEGKPFSKRELEITGHVVNLLTAYKLKKSKGTGLWEDIQNTLITPGLIQPNPDETNREFELRIQDVFHHLIAKLQLYHEPSILVIEKPGPTALKYSLGWGTQTRHYNSRMIDDLNHVRPGSIFQDIDRSRLVIGAVGIVPGPNMNALAAYRDELQKTKSWQDPETEDLNMRYGLAPFTDEAEWKAARIGANLAIMDVANNSVRTVITQMISAAQDSMLSSLVHDILPTYLFKVLTGNMDYIKNPELFSNQMRNTRERQEWEKLLLAVDSVSLYFNHLYPSMLFSSCYDLAAGLVMDNNFGKVDVKTIIHNNPKIQPRKTITVPLLHQRTTFSDKINT